MKNYDCKDDLKLLVLAWWQGFMTVNRSIKSEGAAQEQGFVYYSHKFSATCAIAI